MHPTLNHALLAALLCGAATEGATPSGSALLVLNKVDLLPGDEAADRARKFIADFGWHDKSFIISAIDGKGCRELTYAIMDHLQHTAGSAEDAQEEA